MIDPSELYRLHAEEVRFQVRLGWDRARFTLALCAGLLSVAALAGRGPAIGLSIAACLAAGAGAAVLQMGHGYYQAARNRRKDIETALGISLAFATTKTQRGVKHWWTITKVLLMVHGLLGLLAGAWAVHLMVVS